MISKSAVYSSRVLARSSCQPSPLLVARRPCTGPAVCGRRGISHLGHGSWLIILALLGRRGLGLILGLLGRLVIALLGRLGILGRGWLHVVIGLLGRLVLGHGRLGICHGSWLSLILGLGRLGIGSWLGLLGVVLAIHVVQGQLPAVGLHELSGQHELSPLAVGHHSGFTTHGLTPIVDELFVPLRVDQLGKQVGRKLPARQAVANLLEENRALGVLRSPQTSPPEERMRLTWARSWSDS